MRKLLLGVVALVTLVACEPAIKPPPVPPPVQWVLKQIFYSTVPDPTGVHAPREPHSCMVQIHPAQPSLHASYDTVDPYWRANGWAFMVACVFQAKALGMALPAVKETGDPNTTDMQPVLPFLITTAPIFGTGSGQYDNLSAANVAVWRRAYIEVSG